MDKKADFVISMKASGLEEKVINNIFAKFAKTIQLSLSEKFSLYIKLILGKIKKYDVSMNFFILLIVIT